MSEFEFERRLETLFGDAPELSDAPAFAQGVERRLDRGWALRRWLIGAAGVTGGVVAASQFFMANVIQEVQRAEGSARLVSAQFGKIAGRDWLAVLTDGGSGLWIAAGLAVVSMGFVLSRVIEEI